MYSYPRRKRRRSRPQPRRTKSSIAFTGIAFLANGGISWGPVYAFIGELVRSAFGARLHRSEQKATTEIASHVVINSIERAHLGGMKFILAAAAAYFGRRRSKQ